MKKGTSMKVRGEEEYEDGGPGDDTTTGGSGKDSIICGDGADTITDFSSQADTKSFD